MDANQVARDNHALYYTTVPLLLCNKEFGRVVVNGIDTPSQYPFEGNYSGYIRIDASDVKRNCSDGSFTDEIIGGLLGKVALKFPRSPTGEGMNAVIIIDHEIWRFSFTITQYERDGDHGYEIVDDPLSLPEGEHLGRLIELKVTVIQ
ncbi:MAG: hypothetical protein K9M10_01680 [Candidatus Pacebacteria bacterium]|nr:hypothetical protein [Candidatus Paceibacterota bacterium]MCF7857173.1 hypothetical protein [Candidatus Paceibacterota bacterium]